MDGKTLCLQYHLHQFPEMRVIVYHYDFIQVGASFLGLSFP
jgi:hypothetical protein